jgi:hypothetical protein
MGNTCECVNVDQNHENIFIDLNSIHQLDMNRVLEEKNGVMNVKDSGINCSRNNQIIGSRSIK